MARALTGWTWRRPVERGIVVTNTPSANAVSVAELAVGLMLALARSIPAADAATKSGHWPRLSGVSLEGKAVGLLGLGAIGRQVARRLQGFDCDIVAHDPAVDDAYASSAGVRLMPADEVVGQADFLSLHVPVLPSTRGMVDARFLGRMKQGAFLVNTARGELVDEEALVQALRSGHLRGAALDAFSSEPPDPDSLLLTLPNVIATPHTGAHTDGATNAMGWGALNDCLAVLRGEEPANPISLVKALYRSAKRCRPLGNSIRKAEMSMYTFYFVGVTTGQSSIMKVFPLWMDVLGRPDVVIEGIDHPPHDRPEAYRATVDQIKRTRWPWAHSSPHTRWTCTPRRRTCLTISTPTPG